VTSRLQQGLVGIQVALTVVLLVGGGLLGRSLGKLVSVDPGFDPGNLATIKVPLPVDGYENQQEKTVAMRRLIQKVRTLPGVQSAALAADLPFPGDRVYPVSFRMQDESGNSVERDPDVFRVWSGYFETLRIPLRAGRVFSNSEDRDAPSEIVVSESAAREYWPGGSPVGSTVQAFGVSWVVTGVVGDVLSGSLGSAPTPVFYVPLLGLPGDQLRVVARAKGDAAGLVETMRKAVRALDPRLPVAEESTMQAWVLESTREERYRTSLVAVFAVLSVLTAVVGIFGVTARSLRQRNRELGLRMALGAKVHQLLLSTLKGSMLTGVVGVFFGLLLAFWFGRVVARFLFGIQPHDPLTFAAVAVVVLAACGVAALLPAQRVAAVDPAKALRED
jgi:putative ABC transport system permease protein